MVRFPIWRLELREALLIAAVLLAYSNGLALLAQRRGDIPETFFRRLNPSVAALMLVYAAVRPGGWAGVGLRRAGLGRSLLGGLGFSIPLYLWLNWRRQPTRTAFNSWWRDV